MKIYLIEGSVAKKILGMSIAMSVGILAVVLFNVIDVYFIAQLGQKQLEAISFTLPVAIGLTHLSMGLGTGISVLAARAIGENNHAENVRISSNGTLLFLIIAVVISSIAFFSEDILYDALGADESHMAIIKEYLHIWYFGLVFATIATALNHIIRATGNMSYPAVVLIVATIINLILDPILIFGWGFIPAYGVAGAAIASVVAYAAGCLIMAVFCFKNKLINVGFLISPQKFLGDTKDIFHIGLPTAISYISPSIAYAIITAIIAKFGAEIIAAYGVSLRLEALAVVLFMGLSISVNVFVAQNDAANLHDRVTAAIKFGFKFCIIAGASVAALLFLFKGELAALFSSDAQTIKAIESYLWIVPITYIFTGMTFVISSSFNAVKKPFISLTIMVTRHFVLSAMLAYILSGFYGYMGVIYGLAIANILSFVVSYVMLKRLFNHRLKENA